MLTCRHRLPCHDPHPEGAPTIEVFRGPPPQLPWGAPPWVEGPLLTADFLEDEARDKKLLRLPASDRSIYVS